MKKILIVALITMLGGSALLANTSDIRQKYIEYCKYFNIEVLDYTDAELSVLVPKMEAKKEKEAKALEIKKKKEAKALEIKKKKEAKALEGDILPMHLKQFIKKETVKKIKKNEFGDEKEVQISYFKSLKDKNIEDEVSLKLLGETIYFLKKDEERNKKGNKRDTEHVFVPAFYQSLLQNSSTGLWNKLNFTVLDIASKSQNVSSSLSALDVWLGAYFYQKDKEYLTSAKRIALLAIWTSRKCLSLAYVSPFVKEGEPTSHSYDLISYLLYNIQHVYQYGFTQNEIGTLFNFLAKRDFGSATKYMLQDKKTKEIFDRFVKDYLIPIEKESKVYNKLSK